MGGAGIRYGRKKEGGGGIIGRYIAGLFLHCTAWLPAANVTTPFKIRSSPLPPLPTVNLSRRGGEGSVGDVWKLQIDEEIRPRSAACQEFWNSVRSSVRCHRRLYLYTPTPSLLRVCVCSRCGSIPRCGRRDNLSPFWRRRKKRSWHGMCHK